MHVFQATGVHTLLRHAPETAAGHSFHTESCFPWMSGTSANVGLPPHLPDRSSTSANARVT